MKRIYIVYREIYVRVVSEMPIFFRRLRTLALSLAGLGTAIVAASSQMPTLHIPAIITQGATYLIFGGLVAAGVAQTTKSDTNDKDFPKTDKTESHVGEA